MRHPKLGFIPDNLSELADAKELEEIIGRLDNYLQETREIGYELQRHPQKLAVARERDDQAFAEAIKGRKKPPEEKHAEKAEEERAARERRSRALAVLVEEVASEARTHIQEHLEEWRKQSEGSLEHARERFGRAIEELPEARRQFYATWSALEWLEDPNRKYNPKGGEAPVTLNLDKSPGAVPRQRAEVLPILEALRYELGAPERRKAKPERHKAKPAAVFLVDDGNETEVG
jgi:hypothetical protein